MKPVLQKGAWERLSKLKQVEALASPGDGRLPVLPLMPGKNAAERAYLRRRAAKLNDYASKFRGTTLPQRQWGAAWMFSANLNPALREFGSSGLARLGRVQEALGRIDGNLSLRQGALAKHGGGPGGWASVKASRDSLKQQQRAQLSKFRQKLNQSELRYEQYPPDFHPSFGSGPQIGWGPAFADYPKFPRDKKYNLDANLKPALRELAARSGRIVEFGDGAGDAQLPGGGSTALMGAGLTGLGVWNHKLVKNDPSRFFRHLPKATMAGGLLLAGMGAERLRQERQRNRVSELAARSGRIVEFGDGEADDAVLSALKAVASADESSAQRAMLLKRGLIEMVAGQVVITERGYEMMQKAGMPPKLTPEERREEIAGTEEKRLSRFDHRGHGEWLR